MDERPAAGDQVYEAAPVTEIVVVSFLHSTDFVVEIVNAGSDFTVTVTCAESLHPVPFVRTAWYIPDALTLIFNEVEPLLHINDPVPFAVKITESPWQKVVGPEAEIVVPGNGLTVTNAVAVLAVLLQPDAVWASA